MFAALLFGLAAVYPWFGLIAATCIIPYERREWKAAFFLLSVCHALSGYGFDPYIWSYAAIVFGHVLFMPQIVTKYPYAGHAALVLVPIHSWHGLAQACFMPWRFGRYETRAIVQGDEIWLVRRGYFVHRKHGGQKVLDQNDAVSMMRPLSDRQRAKLQNLTGKRRIYGIRDCSVLERIACSG